MMANAAGDGKDPSSESLAKAVRTVKVTNVSMGATLQEIKDFFSFCGDIEFVEMRSDIERTRIAFVTFRDSLATETAVLLSDNLSKLCVGSCSHPEIRQSGAKIVDLSVSVTLDPDYQLPPATSEPHAVAEMADRSVSASPNLDYQHPPSTSTPTLKKEKQGKGFRRAEDVITGMLAKGFVLGKDAVNKAKSFDDKHHLTSNATSKLASFDKKIGLTRKTSAGTLVMNNKFKEVDQKYQVSEKAKSSYAVAEKKADSAASAMMKNKHVFAGASYAIGAFNKVTKAAREVDQKKKGKVGADEEDQKKKMKDDYTP